MRVVLDANVIISGLLSSGSPTDELRRAWESGHFTLISSEWQLAELRRVSRYPHLKDRFAPHEAGRLVRQIRRLAEIVEPAAGIYLSADPDDTPILATAIAGGAQYLVTGDKSHLLSLVKAESVRIVTAREMCALIT